LKRVNKELANIRKQFGAKKQVNGYQKKKYVAKLVFIFLLGHDVEFGHLEAVNLLSSMVLSEKQIVSAARQNGKPHCEKLGVDVGVSGEGEFVAV